MYNFIPGSLLAEMAAREVKGILKADRDLVQMAFDEIVEMEQFDGTVKENEDVRPRKDS